MKKISRISLGIMAAAAVTMTSCSDKAPFIGSWTAVNPTDITAKVPGATNATSLVTIDFIDNLQKSGGNVSVSADINVDKTIEGDSLSAGNPYQVRFAASATAPGTWTYDIDDDDDLLLALDLSKLDVKIDPANVSLTATGVEQARLDSLATVYVDEWKRGITRILSSDLARYTVIEDIEVARDGSMLSLELQSPKEKLHFKKNAD